jgi:hypothetical protein
VSVIREPGISTKSPSFGLWSVTQMSNTKGEDPTVTSSVPLMPTPSMQFGTVIELTLFEVAAYEAAGARAETASIAAADSQASRRRVPPRRREETGAAFMVWGTRVTVVISPSRHKSGSRCLRGFGMMHDVLVLV